MSVKSLVILLEKLEEEKCRPEHQVRHYSLKLEEVAKAHQKIKDECQICLAELSQVSGLHQISRRQQMGELHRMKENTVKAGRYKTRQSIRK
ncbi:coiled-coil domain-containing protein 169 [Saccopteryx leptura]|uniref:coiled-coil domain-containing protein 169 n=1 Tax=Saccopteryx leptura TaxID=249018 RepID=UPI00339C7F38